MSFPIEHQMVTFLTTEKYYYLFSGEVIICQDWNYNQYFLSETGLSS